MEGGHRESLWKEEKRKKIMRKEKKKRKKIHFKPMIWPEKKVETRGGRRVRNQRQLLRSCSSPEQVWDIPGSNAAASLPESE